MTARRWAALGVVLVFVVGVVVGQAAERVFPAEGEDWGGIEWRQMTDSERFFFVHGHAMGTYVTYQVVAQAVDSGLTITELLVRLRPTRRYLQAGGPTALRATTNYYARGGTAALMVAPLTATAGAPQEGTERSNL